MDNTKPSDVKFSYWLYKAFDSSFHSTQHTGKWLIDCKDSEECDELWFKLYAALFAGKLGPAIKASTDVANQLQRASHRGKIIVVYVDDYEEEEAKLKVLKGLRKLGIKKKLRFKRDIETIIGKYGRNSFWMQSPKGLEVSRYAWSSKLENKEESKA